MDEEMTLARCYGKLIREREKVRQLEDDLKRKVSYETYAKALNVLRMYAYPDNWNGDMWTGKLVETREEFPGKMAERVLKELDVLLW